ncbi:MAG TPA: hypothetical protein VF223_01460 [Trebonia sp.]
MLVHARSGDAVFAACLRFFRNYPMAVRRHYAEHRYGSMVLMNCEAGTARFYVLIMEWDDLFVLRHWDRRDGMRVEIRAHEPVPGEVRQVIETSVPVPRDGALLGWVSGYQVQAVLAAYARLPEPWDDASVLPGVLVMPLVGSQPAEWPPLAASPLDDGRLWEYVESGRLTDLGPLVTRSPGCVFLVPGGDGTAGPRRASTRVVVTERLNTEDFWLPAGVYTDHWTLREGTPVMTARQLLALPGVVDLAGGRGHQHLLGV